MFISCIVIKNETCKENLDGTYVRKYFPEAELDIAVLYLYGEAVFNKI